MCKSSCSIDSTFVDSLTCSVAENETNEKDRTCSSRGDGRQSRQISSRRLSGGVVRRSGSGSGGSSWESRGHPDHDPDRFVSASSNLSSTPHTGRRVGLGEYNFAGVCGVSRPLPSLSSTPTSSLSQCTQARENEIEAKERKAHCQTKKTQQREENCIVISRRCDENNKNYEEKNQASSRKRSTDCEMVVDKIRPLRTKAKQQTNKAARDENIQK